MRNSSRRQFVAYQLVLRNAAILVEIENIKNKLRFGVKGTLGDHSKRTDRAQGINPVRFQTDTHRVTHQAGQGSNATSSGDTEQQHGK